MILYLRMSSAKITSVPVGHMMCWHNLATILSPSIKIEIVKGKHLGGLEPWYSQEWSYGNLCIAFCGHVYKIPLLQLLPLSLPPVLTNPLPNLCHSHGHGSHPICTTQINSTPTPYPGPRLHGYMNNTLPSHAIKLAWCINAYKQNISNFFCSIGVSLDNILALHSNSILNWKSTTTLLSEALDAAESIKIRTAESPLLPFPLFLISLPVLHPWHPCWSTSLYLCVNILQCFKWCFHYYPTRAVVIVYISDSIGRTPATYPLRWNSHHCWGWFLCNVDGTWQCLSLSHDGSDAHMEGIDVVNNNLAASWRVLWWWWLFDKESKSKRARRKSSINAVLYHFCTICIQWH